MRTLVLKRRQVIFVAVLLVCLLVLWFAWQYCTAVRETIKEIKGLRASSSQVMAGKVNEISAMAAVSGAPNLSGNTDNPNTGNTNTGSNAAISLGSMGSKARSDRGEFFAYFRMERDRVRSQQLELLREMAADPSTAAETRSEAQNRILELTQQMEKELELENLMVARGFSEAAAFIRSDAATVVLFSPPLGQEQRLQITSLVARMTGCPEEKVNVICR